MCRSFQSCTLSNQKCRPVLLNYKLGPIRSDTNYAPQTNRHTAPIYTPAKLVDAHRKRCDKDLSHLELRVQRTILHWIIPLVRHQVLFNLPTVSLPLSHKNTFLHFFKVNSSPSSGIEYLAKSSQNRKRRRTTANDRISLAARTARNFKDYEPMDGESAAEVDWFIDSTLLFSPILMGGSAGCFVGCVARWSIMFCFV